MNSRSVLGCIFAGLTTLLALVGAARRERVTICGKRFELASPISFENDRVCIEIVIGVAGNPATFDDFMAIQGNLVARRLSLLDPVDVDAAALSRKGIRQLAFCSKSLPIQQQGEFVVRLEGLSLPRLIAHLNKAVQSGDAA